MRFYVTDSVLTIHPLTPEKNSFYGAFTERPRSTIWHRRGRRPSLFQTPRHKTQENTAYHISLGPPCPKNNLPVKTCPGWRCFISKDLYIFRRSRTCRNARHRNTHLVRIGAFIVPSRVVRFYRKIVGFTRVKTCHRIDGLASNILSLRITSAWSPVG